MELLQFSQISSFNIILSFKLHDNLLYFKKNVKVEYFVGLNNYADSILTLIGRGTNGII